MKEKLFALCGYTISRSLLSLSVKFQICAYIFSTPPFFSFLFLLARCDLVKETESSVSQRQLKAM